MSEFTVKRRSFLLAAILAPLARPLAALGIEPKRRGSEFTIESDDRRHKWTVLLTEDGLVDSVTYSNGKDNFSMWETINGIGYWLGDDSWRDFNCHFGRVFAQITFRVIDANTIHVDGVSVWEQMPPLTAVKDSKAEPEVEIDWVGGSMEKMGSL